MGLGAKGRERSAGREAQENAMGLAKFLSNHPRVAWVRYPGLPDHPHHEVARKQMDGFGAMLCFGVKNGLEGGKILMDQVLAS